MITPKNTVELFSVAQTRNLYTQLIAQLNKDLMLSNIEYEFSLTAEPNSVKKQLCELLLSLISKSYDDYLNLLYRIDVSEKELLKVKEKELTAIVEHMSFIILKREYQKVWFKNTL